MIWAYLNMGKLEVFTCIYQQKWWWNGGANFQTTFALRLVVSTVGIWREIWDQLQRPLQCPISACLGSVTHFNGDDML
jgi:hypothetical protein